MNTTYSRLLGIGYFVAAILFLFPAVDLIANAWPLAPGRVSWRYGSYMLVSGFVLTMVLGAALALLIARAGRHRVAARVVGLLSAVTGIVLITAAVVFSLDALQLRASVTGEARTPFGIGALKALFKNLTAAAAFMWIAFIGWRRDRAMREAKGEGAPIVTGRP